MATSAGALSVMYIHIFGPSSESTLVSCVKDIHMARPMSVELESNPRDVCDPCTGNRGPPGLIALSGVMEVRP